MKTSERAKEIAMKHGHEWMAERIAQLEAVVEPIKRLRERYKHSALPWWSIVQRDQDVIIDALVEAISALVESE